MKRNYLTLMFLVMACTVMSGCKEKEDGCESYSPWPSADAMAAWKEYSPERIYDTSAYNNVCTVLDYFGARNDGYDSTIFKYGITHDTFLLCGYVKEVSFPGIRGFYLVDNLDESNLSEQTGIFTTYLLRFIDEIDTTQKQYLKATVQMYTMEDYREFYYYSEWPTCASLGYSVNVCALIPKKQ